MTTNTDAAREAAGEAIRGPLEAMLISRGIVLDSLRNDLGEVSRKLSDAAVDRFLTTSLEGARPEFVAQLRYWSELDAPLPQGLKNDCSFAADIVTALSAKNAALVQKVRESVAKIDQQEAQLTAQKAAHAKMLRDEADRQRNFAWGPDGHLGNAHSAETLRHLAAKIEGGSE